jgi:hypothetical protein
MKCIKLIKQSKGRELGDIMRTNDIDAELRVKGGSWGYIPKSEWKLSKGKKIIKETTTQDTEHETVQVEKKSSKKKSK